MTRRYRVSIEREALRALTKLDKPIRRRIQTAIDRLAEDPRPPGVRALVARPGAMRLRVGDYRVVYEVRDDRLLVLVIDLGTGAGSTGEPPAPAWSARTQPRYSPNAARSPSGTRST